MARKFRTYLLIGSCALAVVACTSTNGGSTERMSAEEVAVVSPPPAPPPPPPAPPPQSMIISDVAQAQRMVSVTGMKIGAAPAPGMEPQLDRERYEDVDSNPIKRVSDEPVSTFSVDVDTASYSVVRRYLNDGILPPKDAVRIEEMINYFDYAYPVPESSDPPFSTNVTIVPSPWSEENMLMHVGLQGYEIDADERPPLNLTLLVDVSGSMNSPDKLPLAKKALGMLIEQMTAEDNIAIVVYAGAAGTVLEPTSGDDKAKIMAALERLSAGGSTAGGEGLRRAYALAEQSFDEDAVNRVMLLTDGDFNVGITSDERLEDFVSRKRDSGVYLSVMGFGRGNYNDAMMQKIAQTGNGMAAYVDTLNEARKLLSDDLSGSLFTIAKDVKIQVEFNPEAVTEYRLIGYETRMLEEADFNNDEVDAGEIGAGHRVTAIYEITPIGAKGMLDERRYQQSRTPRTDIIANEFAFLKLRYKLPESETSKLIEVPITHEMKASSLSAAPQSTRLATAVAGFGQLLKGEPYLNSEFDYDDVIEIALNARGEDAFGYRSEFVQLVRSAKTAAAQEALQSSGSNEGVY
ncbi:MAG: hypothetical protein CMK06_00970 [Ponticaulis sp.]|nr:hypothetical protein [Ponticaulis sp.]